MKDLQGKVAVITGAGSGFGRELALVCAAEGMKLVLADLDQAGLEQTLSLLPTDCDCVTATTDVSKAAQVETLADTAWARFGGVHLLFNNAGVATAGPVWTATAADWQWVLGVNLMGVVHGLQAFVQRMIDQDEACHVVNTASVAGLLSVPGSGVYCVSKHAVVTLSEVLYHEMKMAAAKVGVSVLCPAFVPTGIGDSERHRPDELADRNPHPWTASMNEMARTAVAKGKMSAGEVARMTLDAVKQDRFYVLTHPKIKKAVEARITHLLEDKPPHNPMGGLQ